MFLPSVSLGCPQLRPRLRTAQCGVWQLSQWGCRGSGLPNTMLCHWMAITCRFEQTCCSSLGSRTNDSALSQKTIFDCYNDSTQMTLKGNGRKRSWPILRTVLNGKKNQDKFQDIWCTSISPAPLN